MNAKLRIKRRRHCQPLSIIMLLPLLAAILTGLIPAHGQDKQQAPKKKEIAGKADVLRHVPKKFATLIRVNVNERQVALHIEEEEEPGTWEVNPDAELKIHGWWGRLEQFQRGDRVWVWFAIDRNKRPKSVLMLADEISEQHIHGLPHTVKSFAAQEGTVTVHSKVSGERTLEVASDVDFSALTGNEVFIQSAGGKARLVASTEEFEAIKELQKTRLRDHWRREGLPGAVTFSHPLSGEMEVMLDHEAMRWGRHLKNGDPVTLMSAPPIEAVVKQVLPWRERTQLRLVTKSGVDQNDLSLGQRITLRVPEPPPEIQASELPSDIGRLRTKPERLEWFLASIYCPCKIAGDKCTGMFYTQASCNVNACGMPNQIRRLAGELIEEGMTDEQIWHALKKRRGSQATKQHLLH